MPRLSPRLLLDALNAEDGGALYCNGACKLFWRIPAHLWRWLKRVLPHPLWMQPCPRGCGGRLLWMTPTGDRVYPCNRLRSRWEPVLLRFLRTVRAQTEMIDGARPEKI